MLRVLVAGFGGIAGRGIRAILRPPEFLVEECPVDAVTALVAATHPDVLLLETGPYDGFGRDMRSVAVATGTTVVECSAHRTTLRVHPPTGGCFTRPLSEHALLDSVRAGGRG